MGFKTDQALWYNNGVWGELAYAVPNFGDDHTTLNHGIHYLTSSIGANLFAIMHHPDVDLRNPPSINTLTRIHKLIVRARSILAGRAVPPATPDMESTHSSPSQEVFLIYPVPYFKVRNGFLKEYCGLVLNALSEAMQHTENRKAYEISTTFSGLIGQYLHRIYKLMATELFGVPAADADKLDFTLSDDQLQAYDPSKYFTSTEMVDTVPPIVNVPTEDDLVILRAGIPATHLVGLCTYPSDGVVEDGSTATATAEESAASFSPAPSP